MAQLPPDGEFVIQQHGGVVNLSHRDAAAPLVTFNPGDANAAALAQATIAGLEELTEEQRAFAHFWSGYFYAHAAGGGGTVSTPEAEALARRMHAAFARHAPSLRPGGLMPGLTGWDGLEEWQRAIYTATAADLLAEGLAVDLDTPRAADVTAPSCRCEPGDRHPLCPLHGEKADPTCACWRPGQALEPPEQDPDCPIHGRVVDPYGEDAPERVDPWLTLYDPFLHGALTAPRHWTSAAS